MKKTEKQKKNTVSNISSTERLEDILNETEKELEAIQPQIDKLEKQLDKLKDLKLAKQKLITLKLSIKSILSNFSSGVSTEVLESGMAQKLSSLAENLKPSRELKTSQKPSFTSVPTHAPQISYPGTNFLPELAFQQVNLLLRKTTSINYDLFRAIVFNGGKATTEEIRQYLVENHVKQPGSGEGFEQVELTDISSRVNYLVRKGIVKPEGRRLFISLLGWTDANQDG